jgi:hypothetical protein
MDNHSSLAPGYQPRTIQVKLDGVVVASFSTLEPDDWVKNLPTSYTPQFLEMLWDGEVVYAQTREAIVLDRINLGVS